MRICTHALQQEPPSLAGVFLHHAQTTCIWFVPKMFCPRAQHASHTRSMPCKTMSLSLWPRARNCFSGLCVSASAASAQTHALHVKHMKSGQLRSRSLDCPAFASPHRISRSRADNNSLRQNCTSSLGQGKSPWERVQESTPAPRPFLQYATRATQSCTPTADLHTTAAATATPNPWPHGKVAPMKECAAPARSTASVNPRRTIGIAPSPSKLQFTLRGRSGTTPCSNEDRACHVASGMRTYSISGRFSRIISAESF